MPSVIIRRSLTHQPAGERTIQIALRSQPLDTAVHFR
jgi:hypothetical protein